MRYSLKTLMIVITLACLLLGGRVEYLRRSAAFHGREVQLLITSLREMTEPKPGVGGFRVAKEGTNLDELNGLAAELTYHQRMQKQYNAAVYRPWTLVRDDRPKWMSP